MYAFKVQINDQEPIIGGAEDLGVLTAIVTATGKLGFSSFPHRGDGTRNIDFRLGGLTTRGEENEDEHFTWLDATELKLGDRILIEIIETDTAHPIILVEAPGEVHDEKSYFEYCKQTYLELREKYEGNA
ncbi:MAG: hypothetical protein CTY16_10150 [Methylobacter sp.]|nr:MAG: hypothetical protein CTY16_10150 [Methylobacter sp.]